MHVTRQYTDAEVADLLDEVRVRVERSHPQLHAGVLAEASKRLRSGMSKTLAQYREESVLSKHAWPIKRAVGMRLQAVPHAERNSYDILWDAACRGVDDGVAAVRQNGAGDLSFPFHYDRDNERLKAWEAAK